MRPVQIIAPAVSLAALMAGGAVHAACVENPKNSYVCDGTQTDGLKDNSDDVSVLVNAGALVENFSGDNGGDVLRVRGDDTIVENNGTLEGDGDGVDSGDDGTGLYVTNTGTINAGSRGINADNENNVTVINSGTINAPTNDGIRLGNGVNAVFTNTGTLIAGDEGLEAGDDATVTNGPAARITAFDDAVQVGERGDIVNEGIIESNGNDGDGIDIDSGRIVNTASGSITTTAAAAAGIDYDASTEPESTILNSGTISGGFGIQVELGDHDPANTQTQIVLTDGIITGTGGTAISLGAGDDRVGVFDSLSFLSTVDLTLGSGAPAQINGLVSLGDGDDTLGFYNTADGGMIYDAVLADLFDGGADTDMAQFSADISELVSSKKSGGVLSLTFANAGLSKTLTFKGFEFFTFGVDPETGTGGTTYTAAQLSAVPLPAGVALLGGGLAALAGLRRLRRRA